MRNKLYRFRHKLGLEQQTRLIQTTANVENIIYRMEDPLQASVLQTVGNITSMQQAGGMITVTSALNNTYVVNCPFFDDESVIAGHQSKF